MTRHTKIVATIGPASRSRETLTAMALAGMDVARLNTSHGTVQDHVATLGLIRDVAAELGRHIGVLMDLGGPKLRTGPTFAGVPLDLKAGTHVTLAPLGAHLAPNVLTVAYPYLDRDVKPGDHILIDDGAIDLEALNVGEGVVDCLVVEGGMVGPRRGVNFPDSDLSITALTGTDREAIRAGVEAGVDHFALSFVTSADDIVAARDLISAAGSDIPIIAKVERRRAITNLQAILEEADGVMVARGDLGVEMLPEDVPVLQRRIIDGAARQMIPVITATQMLESMVQSPRPTRAEASDVANAVWEFSDALMLSEETAIGRFPVQSVAMMERIIRRAESAGIVDLVAAPAPDTDDHSRIIAVAARRIVESDPNMRAIVCFTSSGYTAILTSKQRVNAPLFAFTPTEAVARRLSLARSVIPILSPEVRSLEELMATVDSILSTQDLISEGEEVTILASLPFGSTNPANFLKLHRLGESRATT